jgi:hypothetical protein
MGFWSWTNVSAAEAMVSVMAVKRPQYVAHESINSNDKSLRTQCVLALNILFDTSLMMPCHSRNSVAYHYL